LTERPPLPLWAAVLVAAGAGPVMSAAYPDRGWWPLAFVAIAVLLLALIGRRFWSAALVGLVFGLGYYLTLVTWTSTFLGWVPMTALCSLMGVWFALGSGLIAWAYRWLPRAWPGAGGRMVLLPIAIAGLWTAREAVASVWPYGGFAWGRAGESLIDAPVAPLYAWVGISGMTFLMVWLVALTIEACRYRGVPALQRAIAPIGLAAAMLIWPAWPVPTTGSLRIAMVQGDGPAGYFEHRDPGALITAQYLATAPLFDADVEADLVLWPEGSSDWDPETDAGTARIWDDVSARMGAPLLAQATTEHDGNDYNTAILWQAGSGALDRYDKRHPVPFGEYIPDRDFFHALAPDLVDLVQRGFTPGTTDPVMSIPARSGAVEAAVNICYDIVDDALLRESVRDGGRIILASSNTADFGFSDESVQQLAIARIRAIELGRSVANVSTVGITAVIAPDGAVTASLPRYTAGTIVADVPLADTVTPDAVAGADIELLLGGLGIALLLGGGLAGGVTRREARETAPRR